MLGFFTSFFDRHGKTSICVVASAFLLLNLGAKFVLISSYLPEFGGFERNVIWGIQQIMLGRSLYFNPEEAPFGIVQYMPLFYYTVAFVGKGLNLNPLDAHSIYFLARALNLLFCTISVFLVFKIARVLHVEVWIAVLVAIVGFLWLDKFALAGRCDALKVLLYQTIMYGLLQVPEVRSRWIFPVVGLLGAMAFLTKQDGLVFCAIMPLALFLGRNWKQGMLWGLFTAGLCVAGVVLVVAIQPFFFTNVAGGLQNGISISWFVGSFGQYFSLMSVPFAVALGMAFEFITEKNWKLHVLASGALLSFFPAIVFAFKYGSAPNYFIEFSLTSLVLFATFLQKQRLGSFFYQKGTAYLVATMAFLLYFYIPCITWISSIYINPESEFELAYEKQCEVAGYIRKVGGKNDFRVLVLNNKQWQDHLTTLMADVAMAPTRDVIVQVHKAQGKINFGMLKQSIENAKGIYIITDVGQKPGFLGFNFGRYHEINQLNGFSIWSSM